MFICSSGSAANNKISYHNFLCLVLQLKVQQFCFPVDPNSWASPRAQWHSSPMNWLALNKTPMSRSHHYYSRTEHRTPDIELEMLHARTFPLEHNTNRQDGLYAPMRTLQLWKGKWAAQSHTVALPSVYRTPQATFQISVSEAYTYIQITWVLCKRQIQILKVWSGACNSASFASSQMTCMLQLQKPCSEHEGCKPLYYIVPFCNQRRTNA